jgi:putative transcriptional regulator
MLVTQHPDQAMLEDYISGDLEEGLAFIVATHLEICKECAESCAELEEAVANSMMATPITEISVAELNILEQIMAHAPEVTSATKSFKRIETTVNGKTFTLPRTLSAIEPQIGRWDKVIGNLWRASIDVGSANKMNLIYMENGGGIAEHTHRGFEATLVLNGEFCDESGTFTAGDFILKDGQCVHKPYTDSHCLCLAVMDKPLHFSSGLARLLNPFSHLFF